MADVHISLAAEGLTTIGSLTVTNAMVTGLVGSVVVLIIFYLASRALTVSPRSRAAQVVESITEMLQGMTEDILHSPAKAASLLPLLLTFFAFILINNWLGLIPGVGSIHIQTAHGNVPLFRAATADLNTTLALALISVGMTQSWAIKELGVVKHLKKYVSLNPIMLFVGFLELVSEVSRVISFTFRLFGNIFAGEVLLVVMTYLVPLLLPVPFYFLEVFVGLIQALVFTLLTLVFIGVATSEHDEAPAAEPA